MNSNKKIARIAGLLYLALVPLGVFGIIYVPTSLIIPGDSAATAQNIIASESLFRLSAFSALLTQLVNIAVVLLLYRLFKQVHKGAARLMVFFLLLGVPIAMLNELNHFVVLELLTTAHYGVTFSTDQLYTLVSLFLNLHEYGVTIASIFWGLWLLPMGYLVFKSGFLPKTIGILLIVGGFGYLIDCILIFLFPHTAITVAQFTFIGEVLLPLYLLIKGVKDQPLAAQHTNKFSS